MLLDNRDNAIHLFGGLAHSKAAYSVSVAVECSDFVHVGGSNVVVASALVDAEKQLILVGCVV